MESNNTNININKTAKAITEEDRRAAAKDAVAQVERNLEALEKRLEDSQVDSQAITEEEKERAWATLNEVSRTMIQQRNVPVSDGNRVFSSEQSSSLSGRVKQLKAEFCPATELPSFLASRKAEADARGRRERGEPIMRPGKLESDAVVKEMGKEQGQKR